MKNDKEEKSLIVINENSILYKIRNFFLKLFNKNQVVEEHNQVEISQKVQERINNNNNSFMEYIRNVENDETRLLKLQKQYRKGEIKEEDLTEEQITSLCALYDKQIASLKKANQYRKQKLLECKNNINN